MSQQESFLRSQRISLENAADLAGGQADTAHNLREEIDKASSHLESMLGTQGSALGGQRENIDLQQQRLRALGEARKEGWKGLTLTAGRASSQIREIVSTVRATINGLFDGSPAAVEGEAALEELSRTLEGHNAAQEGLIHTLRNTTCELQASVLVRLSSENWSDVFGGTGTCCGTASRVAAPGEGAGVAQETNQGYGGFAA